MLGVDAVVEVLAQTGDPGSFRTLQGQPAHRGRPVEAESPPARPSHRFAARRNRRAWAQHRFIAAGSGRKQRIDAALARCFVAHREPAPLAGLPDRLAEESAACPEAADPNARARGSDGALSGS